ncbi:MAG: type I restriction enzyme HsdR N-terminal domain-containing protein [Bacteroidales bacterium]|nr:type I restriction enzyme HsdR N-terminal domain-containing protein [Bacteroidales bacterium]
MADNGIYIRTRADGKREVFDPVRKKYVALTPEEEVRQALVWHLHKTLRIPLGRIGVETGIRVYGLPFRVDLQVFDAHGNAVWLIECKRREQALNAAVLEQIGRYRLSEAFKDVRFLTVTNGAAFYCWERAASDGAWTLRDTLPDGEVLAAKPA